MKKSQVFQMPYPLLWREIQLHSFHVKIIKIRYYLFAKKSFEILQCSQINIQHLRGGGGGGGRSQTTLTKYGGTRNNNSMQIFSYNNKGISSKYVYRQGVINGQNLVNAVCESPPYIINQYYNTDHIIIGHKTSPLALP